MDGRRSTVATPAEGRGRARPIRLYQREVTSACPSPSALRCRATPRRRWKTGDLACPKTMAAYEIRTRWSWPAVRRGRRTHIGRIARPDWQRW